MKLDTSDRAKQSRIITELTELGLRAVDPLIKAFKSESADVRRGACGTLVNINAPHTLEAILPLLRDDDEKVRTVAMCAFWVKWDPRALQPLMDILRDDSNGNRRYASIILGRTGDPGVLDGLLNMLNDPDRMMRIAGIRALGKLGHRDAALSLASFLKSPYDRERASAVLSLGQIGDQSMLGDILNLADDDCPKVRENVAKSLGHFPSDQAFSKLGDIYKTTEYSRIRKAALDAIGKSSHPDAFSFLTTALKEEKKNIMRMYIPDILCERGDLKAVPHLIDALSDKKLCVSNSAYNALKELSKHDFGKNPQAWLNWYETSGK
jgi:HEAT repeat protein